MARRRIGFWGVTFHVIMTLITGGLWLLGIIIYFLINSARSK